MKRVLITGMSGVGKSTLIAALSARGFRAVDLDENGYSHFVPAPEGEITGVGGGQDWAWDEARVQALLAVDDSEALFVSGVSPNQRDFYSQFDHIVLLTAPDEVIVERLTARTNNPFGKEPGQLERTLLLKPMIEPVLRRSATLELDGTRPVDELVEAVLGLVSDRPQG